MTFLYYAFYFVLYSFAGWICETIYCSALVKKFVNRGFLSGPFCPIYGFGALSVILILQPLVKEKISIENFVIVFLVGMIVTTALEYLTAVLLEKLFHAKWWDYSKDRFNIKGRICLKNSVMFGIMSALLMLFIHPAVEKLTAAVPEYLLLAVELAVGAELIYDLINTVRKLLKLNGAIEELLKIQADIEQKIRTGIDEKAAELKERMNAIEAKYAKSNRRLLKAFPKIHSYKSGEILEKIKEKSFRSRRGK